MATLEQVEKLRERANVGYDEAKAALDATNGDLLEALIYLEKQGKTTSPAGGGYYSSAKNDTHKEEKTYSKKENCSAHNDGFKNAIKEFGRFLKNLFNKGNSNFFEVLKGEECKISVPVTVLVLLLIFAFYATIPLLIIGLFFGLHYRFRGPELGNDTVNHAMESASNVAENLKNSVNGDKK